MSLDLSDRRAVNEAAARLCGIVLDFAQYPPDFLSGLRPDGTCDESKVDWKLWGRVATAIRRGGFSLHVGMPPIPTQEGGYGVRCGGTRIHHADPVAALLLAAGHAGLLEEKP